MTVEGKWFVFIGDVDSTEYLLGPFKTQRAASAHMEGLGEEYWSVVHVAEISQLVAEHGVLVIRNAYSV